MDKIHNYDDFVIQLENVGFTMGSNNSEGIFSLGAYFGEEIKWHTERMETDPWEWRMRVLNERDDIAYGKYFFKKSGYITKEWYPYFFAARRGDKKLEEEYENGTISRHAKIIYKLIEEHKELPLHLIKQYGGFGKEDKSKFDSAITELQMKFYIAMCGRARKMSKSGNEFGWSSTVFCLAEDLFEEAVIEKVKRICFSEAYERINEKIYLLNPEAQEKKAKKFILG